MTIVDLAGLDVFIRDSLFEVRRGIANSRNATQSNPMLGVMVDLPEKIDYEIMVTANHQSLSRNIVSSDSDLSSEASLETRSSINKESQKEVSFNASKDGSIGKDSEDTNEDSLSASVERENSLDKKATEEDSFNNSSVKAEESGCDDSNSGTRERSYEYSKDSASETESDASNSKGKADQIQNDTKKSYSRQIEQHAEANDRGGQTFDEDDGMWGGQGQLSTPTLTVTPCTCS